jgi:uncharacterized protein with GYD domain
MPLYMAKLSYSADAWASLVQNPENREEKVRAVLAESGVKLEHLWFTFGEHDAFALIDAPDNVAAAAVSIAVTASGAFASFETSVLMTQEEMLEALEKAKGIAYAAPGARESVPA